MKLWITLLLCATGAVQAQNVWRCGPDGRSYGDAPCRDGRAVEVADTRSATDLHSAQQMARREKNLAAQLVRERQQRESQSATGPAGIRDSRLASTPVAVKPKATAPATGKRRPADADIWRAVAPVSPHSRD